MTDRKPTASVVLGAGGSRGIAHIGALKAIEEKYRIVSISGSSIGAMIGSLYSMHGSAFRVQEVLAEHADWRTGLGLLDPVMNVFRTPALIRGRKVRKFFNKLYKNSSIQDLKIPLKILATDLNSGQAVVLNSGPVATAVSASIAMPPFFAPVRIRGSWLVDGGLSQPLPITALSRSKADKLIACNLFSGEFPGYVQGKKEKVAEVGVRALNIASYHLARSAEEKADAVIRFELGFENILGLKDFFDEDKIESLVRDGYDQAKKQLR